MFQNVFVVALVAAYYAATVVEALHDSYNFILKPVTRECFYEELVVPSSTRVVETFMEAGGLVDITLNIYGPLTVAEVKAESFETPVLTREIDIEDEESSENLAHAETFTAPADGIYAICLDNRKARFVPKVRPLVPNSITPLLLPL